jgi:outer membrane protein insertion porin family
MKTRYRFFPFVILACLLLVHPFLRHIDAQGSPVPITSVVFEGNQGIPEKQLRQQLSFAIEGGRYAAETLKIDLQRVEKLYQDEGFLDAKIGTPDVRIQKSAAGEGAYIRIPITEGPRYASGRISVRNAQVLDPQTILQMCPLQKGQPYRRTQIIQWEAKIEESYHSLGHLRATCKAQESLNAGDRTVDCVLDCVAGKPYSVGRITVVGNESIDRAGFRRRLLLSEGGIYNHDNLILSIQFLNQMQLFKPISYSDVEITIDDVKGTVDLTFNLSPIKQ